MSIRRRIERIEKESSTSKVPLGERIYLIYIGDGKTEAEIKEEIKKNELRLKQKYGSSEGVTYLRHCVPDPQPLSPRFKK